MEPIRRPTSVRSTSQRQRALDQLAATKGIVTMSPTYKQSAYASLYEQDRPVSPVGMGRRRRKTVRRRKGGAVGDVVYVVTENGEVYEHSHKTYQGAVNAVKQRWKEELDSQFKESGMGPRGPGCCEVNVPENKNGRTYLYIEKDIHITIVRTTLADD
jgi:hypothetical protein